MKTRKHLFFIFLSLFLSAQTFSQSPVNVDDISDAQTEQFIKEAESRGLSEAEIEAAARLKGYSSDDIAKFRLRIERLKSGSVDNNPQTSAKTREQIGEVAERTDVQVGNNTEVGKKRDIFGRSLFGNKNLQFEPNLRLPTPPNYVIGPNDELKIDISGFAYQHYDVKVTPEGTIRLESLSPINVSGLTIEQAKVKITNILKVLFGGLRSGGLTLDLTLGNVRSIQVNILGEITNPGTYTLSAFATALNALYLSGGPTVNGSMRTIKILRNNMELASIDLYQFLTTGKLSNQQLLQDQDVIFVPVAEKKIELEGEIKREMVFELTASESLSDAIDYAGGFTEQAYKKNLIVTRYTDTEKKIINTEGLELSNFLLKNGDHVTVGAVLERFENKVEILGAVFRPEAYALNDSMNSLKALIKIADGLREDAFLDRALLIRERENLDPEIISINLKDLFSGKIKDIILWKNDKLIIKSITELRELRTVEIVGSINNPGSFDYADGLKVKDLILMAGGFKEGATTRRMEIARRLFNDESSDETVQVLLFETNKNLNNEGNITLSPFDKVFVRDLPNYEVQKLVNISGEVNYPGTYTILRREERISDLIKRAGGLREESYIEGARFYREGMLVALDLKKALNNENDLGNLILSESDKLVIPKLQEVIKLSGQVLNPTSVAFRPDLRFQDYIAQAGGVSNDAFVRKTYVRYANGLTDRTRSFLGIKNYPEIQRGMEVIVPARIKDRWTSAERIAISTAFVSIATIMVTIIRIL
jgi:polysaccharide export outer membrane protein